MPTPGCFELLRENVDFCLKTILEPLPRLKIECIQMYNRVELPEDKRSPLLHAEASPAVLDAIRSTLETMKVMVPFAGFIAKSEKVMGHLDGIKLLLNSQLEELQVRAAHEQRR